MRLLGVLLLLFSPAATADFRSDYAQGVRMFERGDRWYEVESRMNRAIWQMPPPVTGAIGALDRRQGGLDYIPHAYLAIAILKTHGDCAAARRALEDSGHKKALASVRAAGAAVVRHAEQEFAQACPAGPAEP